jgi:hypothetical protein
VRRRSPDSGVFPNMRWQRCASAREKKATWAAMTLMGRFVPVHQIFQTLVLNETRAKHVLEKKISRPP